MLLYVLCYDIYIYIYIYIFVYTCFICLTYEQQANTYYLSYAIRFLLLVSYLMSIPHPRRRRLSTSLLPELGRVSRSARSARSARSGRSMALPWWGGAGSILGIRQRIGGLLVTHSLKTAPLLKVNNLYWLNSGKPRSWQKVKVLTSKQIATKVK